MKKSPKEQINNIISELAVSSTANLKKGERKGQVDTKANRRIKNGLHLLILQNKESYATISSRTLAKICNVNSTTIIRHGGAIAIKKAWQKADIRRLKGGRYAAINDPTLKAKFLYSAIRQDHQTIDIMLVLGDKHFYNDLCASFKHLIKPHEYGNFYYALYNWLEDWQQNDYSPDNTYWLRLAQIMNSFCIKGDVPLNYNSVR